MSDWSDWIEHDGKGCPVRGQLVCVVNKGAPGEWVGIAGSEGSGLCRSWYWDSGWRPVVRYRTRIYRGGTDLIESIREMEDA